MRQMTFYILTAAHLILFPISAVAQLQSTASETGEEAPPVDDDASGVAPDSVLPDTSNADDTPKVDVGEEKNEEIPPDKKKKKRKKVRVKARIHVRWGLDHEPDKTGDDEVTNEFSIRRARFKLKWEPEPWLMAVLQVGGFHRLGNFRKLLRDAYIHFSPLQYLEVRAGLFKKPFSRLALRSSGKLRVAERGEENELILDDLKYGGRDLGVQISGRLVESVKLDYELGFFNGTNVLDDVNRENGDEKDVVARLTVRPTKWLDIGANSSIKFFSSIEDQEKWAWSAGADAVMKIGGFRFHVEGIAAEDYRATNPLVPAEETRRPLILSGIGILSYRHDFTGNFKLAVEPVFMMEVLEPDIKITEDEVLVYSPGFNSYFGKYLRLMVHGAFRRPFRNSRESFPRSDTLIVQLCFDI
jgi:hypothetical protein